MDKDISKQLTVSRNFKMTRNDKISVGEGLWVRHYEWRSAAPFPPPALPLTTPMSGWGWRTPGSKDLTLSSYPEALHVTSTWFLVQPTSPPPRPPSKVSQVFHCPFRPRPCPWVPHGWPPLHHLTSKIKFQLLIYLRPQVQRKKSEHQFELTFLSHPTLQGVELTVACCFSKKCVNGLDVSLFNIRFCYC